MSKRSFAIALFPVLALPWSLFAQAPSLTVQVDHPTAKVSPMLYGLMTEEINFSYDGGLYPELVRDRTIGFDWQALAHWTLVTKGNSQAKVSPNNEVDQRSPAQEPETRSNRSH